MKNVLGPKVLDPVTRWYEENRDDEGEDEGTEEIGKRE